MKIPFFNYPHVFDQYREELQQIVLDISNRGSFIMQEEGLSLKKIYPNLLILNTL